MSNNQSSKELQDSIEAIMEKTHYENFDKWVTNFALEEIPNFGNMYLNNLEIYEAYEN